jgi:hypothetical protein
MVIVFAFIVINFVVDMVYSVLDPRVGWAQLRQVAIERVMHG